MYSIGYSEEAKTQYSELKMRKDLVKRFKAVQKALKLLSNNPRHPSLNTHEYYNYPTKIKEKIYQSYAENNTPQAYRIFWFYDKDNRNAINIIGITPHP